MKTPKFRMRRSLRAFASLALLLTASTGDAQEAGGKGEAEGPDQRAAEGTTRPASKPDRTRLEAQPGADGSRVFRFRPVFDANEKLKEKLRDYGVAYQLDMAFYYQYASRVSVGQQNFATYSWRASGSWRFFHTEEVGSIFAETTLLGSPGLNYDPNFELITRNISAISNLNGNIYPDSAALDELLLNYVSPSSRYFAAAGKVDLANRFDTNRVANDSFRQFTAFALENNLSIPWPDYGGLGAFVRFNVGERGYVMAAAAESVVDNALEFGRAIGDGNWIEMAEIGVELEVPSLGVGHYRLTPWHVRVPGGDGWGVGINFDQELFHPDLVSFFRSGIGEPSATPIQTFVSGGLAWLRPWGRPDDMLGFGVAWANPSPDQGFQNETLIEIFYRFAIVPGIQLSPELQVVHNPASTEWKGTVVVPGIRLNLAF